MVDFDEPFTKLFNQGMINGSNGIKMSKSKGNVVSPDELVRLKMSELNIFTSKTNYYNLTYTDEKTMSPVTAVLFLVFMGVLGLIFAIKTGKRKKYAH